VGLIESLLKFVCIRNTDFKDVLLMHMDNRATMKQLRRNQTVSLGSWA